MNFGGAQAPGGKLDEGALMNEVSTGLESSSLQDLRG